MEWMCCNCCWLRVSEAKQCLFHLTQCGHYYCDKCITEAKKKCSICGSVETIALPLQEPLSPRIAHFFIRPEELLKKVVEAEQFQESQLALCLKRADEIDGKYLSLKKDCWAKAEKLKKLQKKHDELVKQFKLLQIKAQSSKGSSKMHTPSHVPTPSTQTKSSQQGYCTHKVIDSIMRNNGLLKGSSSTSVPRPAGYSTAPSASKNLSTFKGTTPHS